MQPCHAFADSAGLLHPLLAPLLTAIQGARLYSDSKTAVDLVLAAPPEQVAAAWEELHARSGGSVAGSELAAFVRANTRPPGSDLLQASAPDWLPEPPGFLAHLAAGGAPAEADAAGDSDGEEPCASPAELRAFGLEVHRLWGLLSRRVSPAVASQPQRHSLLPLPHATVVPGDRFRETYYWDSYWVVRGLLVSGMVASALGLVSNLLAMLEQVGHVPNGARCYYLNRSQPPLLSAMVRAVHEACTPPATPPVGSDGGDSSSSSSSQWRRSPCADACSETDRAAAQALLARALPLLQLEHAYWTRAPKAVRVAAADGHVHCLSRYYADWAQPRPESFREDAELAAAVTGSADPAQPRARALYRELASAAESGWDFSSRWCAGGSSSLATIRTTQVVPADLNAWLHQMERNISWAAGLLGQAGTAARFEAAAAARKAAMQALLWDEAAAMWRDGLLQPPADPGASSGAPPAPQQLQQLPGLYASNFVPLWAGLTESDAAAGARVVAALAGSELIAPAGMATSTAASGQQWDAPNGWPPLQHMLVEGAALHGGSAGAAFARRMARRWVSMCRREFLASGCMHEKYDVSSAAGGAGGGGEYAPQVGFGWSNGVVLDLLASYC